MVNSNTPQSNKSDAQSLFFPGFPRWSSNTITYNFMEFIPPSYYANPDPIIQVGLLVTGFLDGGLADPASFRRFDSNQRDAAEDALRLWEEVADVQFVQKADTTLGFESILDLGILERILNAVGKKSDFVEKLARYIISATGAPLVNGADIRFGTANIGAPGGAFPPFGDFLTQNNAIRDKIVGFVDDYLGSITDLVNTFNRLNPFDKLKLPKASDIVRQLPDIKILPFGDVWLNKNDEDNQSENIGKKGSQGFLTLVHEIGHALGLEHPGNYDTRGLPVFGPFLPKGRDSVLYSVMSYDFWEGNDEIARSRLVVPQAPMLYDIVAIQALYGANFKTRSGNNTYYWEKDRPFMATIWDGGGIDTIDASNQQGTSEINLNAGQFSSIGPTNTTTYLKDGKREHDPFEKYNLAIAFGVTIENAIGGVGSDTALLRWMRHT